MLIDEAVASPVRGLLTYPSEGNPGTSVVLCGANPFLGGRPDNPVARSMAESFARRGALVFAWEYDAWRDSASAEEFGAMRSEFWAAGGLAPRDLAGVREAIGFTRAVGNGSRLLLAGYSYGAALALVAGSREGLPVLAASPPLRTLPAGFSTGLATSCLVVAEEDIASTREEEQAFESACRSGWAIRRVLPGQDHFHSAGSAPMDAVIAEWLTILAASR